MPKMTTEIRAKKSSKHWPSVSKTQSNKKRYNFEVGILANTLIQVVRGNIVSNRNQELYTVGISSPNLFIRPE